MHALESGPNDPLNLHTVNLVITISWLGKSACLSLSSCITLTVIAQSLLEHLQQPKSRQ